MLKLYCQKCGALNTYVSEKPNFCQKCGVGFNSHGQKQVQAVTSVAIEEDDEDEGPKHFDLQNLEVDIIPGRSRSETVGSLAKTVEEGGMPLTQEEMPPLPEGQAYTMEDFKKEAGNIRGGNEAEET